MTEARSMGLSRPRSYLAAAACVVVAGCAVVIAGSVGGGRGGASGESGGPSLAEAVDLLPARTLRDWVSYADQVSVVTVTREEELSEPAGTDPRLDEDYVGRRATLHVDRTLWRREGAPSSDDTVQMIVWGWTERDGVRRPFAVRGGARMEVGRR
jgi:hypothetical protein